MAYFSLFFQIRFTCEIIVCLFCVIYIILEVVETGSQGVKGFIKKCVSKVFFIGKGVFSHN